jgi:hypothetical protein
VDHNLLQTLVLSLHAGTNGRIEGKTKKLFAAIEFRFGPKQKPVQIGVKQLENIAKKGII